MKYTKEQRLEIGRQIHESGLSDFNGCQMFDICEESARRYRILYERSKGLQHVHIKTGKTKKTAVSTTTSDVSGTEIEDYSSMTKEQLIAELMKSQIREARLKKGYMVKGVGADKEYVLFDNKNIK